MNKSTPIRKYKRPVGRPKTGGPGLQLLVRMHKPQIEAIDHWIRDSGISRPEAIRQLVNYALKGSTHA
jgi:ribbon-helix-helix CopG family protein